MGLANLRSGSKKATKKGHGEALTRNCNVENDHQPNSKKKLQKVQKKIQFYSKVQDVVASLGAKKSIKKKKVRSRQKKVKAYDFSSLADCLPDLTEKPRQAPLDTSKGKLTWKRRRNLLLEERKSFMNRYNSQVLKSNPFESVYEHLLKTQPPSTEEVKKERKNGSSKRKNKGSSNSQSMVI